ncbi:MAG: hypothetical protein CVU06_02005 [Bacteroidetes bacterium HGW-Bacteroidetes-22]|nr:MAG: hypothetical protein CVU06_02005 [Bacteroidetes bacterium HGW-Bacteroidetes-22]
MFIVKPSTKSFIMKSNQITLVALSMMLLLASCRKDQSDPVTTTVTNSKDLKVADGFNWATTKTVEVNINVESDLASGLLSKVMVFKADPTSGTTPTASGSAGFGFPYATDIIVPAALEGMWIEMHSSGGAVEVVYQAFSGNNLSYTFQTSVKADELKSVVTGPDCTSGCDVTVSTNQDITVKQGKTYCLTTTNFTKKINFEPWNGGGTVRICGVATPSQINNFGGYGGNCNLVISDGGKLTFNDDLALGGVSSITAWHTSEVYIEELKLNQESTSFTNYSSNFTIHKAFSPSGVVTNYGTLTLDNKYESNSPNGKLINSGTITTVGYLQINNALTNSGTINVGTDFDLNNSAGNYSNTCKIIVGNNASLNSGALTMNGGYLKAEGKFQVNGVAVLNLQNQSMVSANNVVLNNSISGAGSLNSIVSTGNATINSGKTVSGAIEWVDDNGVLTNGTVALFINGASFKLISEATNFIPVSDCNPEGIGSTPVITDTDGDGVADINDDYPEDATRAYNNYYPSATTWSSMAFEDLWPAYGDYDMNDLVVNIRFNRVTNAQNKVVDVINLYDVKAVGGALRNGFGFQLDNVDVGVIESVTGYSVNPGSYITLGTNGLETGTTKPVIILWDDAENVITRVGGEYFNTEHNGYVGTSEPVTINVHFSTPQTTAMVGLPPFNHFLIKGKVRGTEIHQPGMVPTSKANTELFGTGDDDTNPTNGKYYKSVTNLPWSIFVAEEFDYPLEEVDIVNAHLKFAAWAESNGAQYSDWYMDKAGYRNTEKIY